MVDMCCVVVILSSCGYTTLRRLLCLAADIISSVFEYLFRFDSIRFQDGDGSSDGDNNDLPTVVTRFVALLLSL